MLYYCYFPTQCSIPFLDLKEGHTYFKQISLEAWSALLYFDSDYCE
jgi:hypothetical protein